MDIELVEPSKLGKPLSVIMTEVSLRNAREEYKKHANGLFSPTFLSGTHVESLIRDLSSAEKKFKTEDFTKCPFDVEDEAPLKVLLALPPVVIYEKFIWRGRDGNCTFDRRFDVVQTWDSTEETELRSRFIDALSSYCLKAAAWSEELKIARAKDYFLEVCNILKDAAIADSGPTFTEQSANNIVPAFKIASELLWDEWQKDLVKRGVILDKETERRLFTELEESIARIESIASEAIECIKPSAGEENWEIYKNALIKIDEELGEKFTPNALEYSKSEEAQPYDESSITCAVDKLCKRMLDEKSSDYELCRNSIDAMGKQLEFPINSYNHDFHEFPATAGNKRKCVPLGWLDLWNHIFKIEEAATKEKNNPKAKPIRGKGYCQYDGRKIHRSINAAAGHTEITVNGQKYQFTGYSEWGIINRFLSSMKNLEDNTPGNFPVKLSSKEYNKCKGECRKLVADFIEREERKQHYKNAKYTGLARFRVEKLR